MPGSKSPNAVFVSGSSVKDRLIRGLVQGGPSNVLGVVATSEQESHQNASANDTTTEASSTRDLPKAAMMLTGVAGAVLANIPPVRSALLAIALGKTAGRATVPE